METQQKVSEPITVTCDICKKVYDILDECEIQEFEFIRRKGGYNSVFGDEYVVEMDICQHCLKKLIGDYVDEKGLSRATLHAQTRFHEGTPG